MTKQSIINRNYICKFCGKLRRAPATYIAGAPSGPECCGHRDVLPMAGATGFDPQAWCPDCSFFKLRRTPKKRSPDDYRY